VIEGNFMLFFVLAKVPCRIFRSLDFFLKNHLCFFRWPEKSVRLQSRLEKLLEKSTMDIRVNEKDGKIYPTLHPCPIVRCLKHGREKGCDFMYTMEQFLAHAAGTAEDVLFKNGRVWETDPAEEKNRIMWRCLKTTKGVPTNLVGFFS